MLRVVAGKRKTIGRAHQLAAYMSVYWQVSRDIRGEIVCMAGT